MSDRSDHIQNPAAPPAPAAPQPAAGEPATNAGAMWVSILIPTYNRSKILGRTLDSLAHTFEEAENYDAAVTRFEQLSNLLTAAAGEKELRPPMDPIARSSRRSIVSSHSAASR